MMPWGSKAVEAVLLAGLNPYGVLQLSGDLKNIHDVCSNPTRDVSGPLQGRLGTGTCSLLPPDTPASSTNKTSVHSLPQKSIRSSRLILKTLSTILTLLFHNKTYLFLSTIF